MLPLFPQDYIDTEMLLCAENVNQDHLLSYAREAADFATNYQLPSLDFAMNHYEQPDVAMFDFTCMYASENAALVRERQSHQLLVALVGDSLLEVPPARGAPSLLPEERSLVHVCLAASAVTQLGEGRPSASRQDSTKPSLASETALPLNPGEPMCPYRPESFLLLLGMLLG